MDDNILFREELKCLLDMVRQEIFRVGSGASISSRAALGHLHGKIERMLKVAPSLVPS